MKNNIKVQCKKAKYKRLNENAQKGKDEQPKFSKYVQWNKNINITVSRQYTITESVNDVRKEILKLERIGQITFSRCESEDHKT